MLRRAESARDDRHRWLLLGVLAFIAYLSTLQTAPGANCNGYVRSPPGLGRSSRAGAFKVVDVLAFSGLRIGASLLTSTVSRDGPHPA